VNPEKNEYQPGELQVGWLNNPDDIALAVNFLRQGYPIAGQVRGVFGIWANAQDSSSLEKVTLAKKTPEKKALSSMMFSQDLFPLVDRNLVHQEFHQLLDNPRTCQIRFGGICHLRVPVSKKAASEIPPILLSEKEGVFYMHNLDPFGHPIAHLIRAAKKKGLPSLAVTSLNDHSVGENEISDWERAQEFCQQKIEFLPIILRDPIPRRDEVRGSFAIVDLAKKSAVRDGHIPISFIERLFQTDLDKGSMQPSKYSQIKIEIGSLALSPEAARVFILWYIRGKGEAEIIEKLKKAKLLMAV